ncbi:MAG: hypothetical protein FD165_2270, partial [Gammaproteobacteria bacterium]
IRAAGGAQVVSILARSIERAQRVVMQRGRRQPRVSILARSIERAQLIINRLQRAARRVSILARSIERAQQATYRNLSSNRRFQSSRAQSSARNRLLRFAVFASDGFNPRALNRARATIRAIGARLAGCVSILARSIERAQLDLQQARDIGTGVSILARSIERAQLRSRAQSSARNCRAASADNTRRSRHERANPLKTCHDLTGTRNFLPGIFMFINMLFPARTPRPFSHCLGFARLIPPGALQNPLHEIFRILSRYDPTVQSGGTAAGYLPSH